MIDRNSLRWARTLRLVGLIGLVLSFGSAHAAELLDEARKGLSQDAATKRFAPQLAWRGQYLRLAIAFPNPAQWTYQNCLATDPCSTEVEATVPASGTDCKITAKTVLAVKGSDSVVWVIKLTNPSAANQVVFADEPIAKNPNDFGIHLFDTADYKNAGGKVWNHDLAASTVLKVQKSVSAKAVTKASAYNIYMKFTRDGGKAWESCDAPDPIIINHGE